MNDDQIAGLKPKMQEAVKFVQFWNLSRSLPEFLAAVGRPHDDKGRLWASTTATLFRKNGVNLKKFTASHATGDEYDYAYLQMIGERSLAELGRRRAEAEDVIRSITELREQAVIAVRELRKYKDAVVMKEKMEQFGLSHNGGN